jgi:hypothetical protein
MLTEPQKAAQLTRQTLSFWTSFLRKPTSDCNAGRLNTASAPKLPTIDRRNFLVVHPASVAVHGVVSWCCNHCERILLKYAATANYESHSTGTQTYKLWRVRFKSHRDVREHLLADRHLVGPDSKGGRGTRSCGRTAIRPSPTARMCGAMDSACTRNTPHSRAWCASHSRHGPQDRPFPVRPLITAVKFGTMEATDKIVPWSIGLGLL